MSSIKNFSETEMNQFLYVGMDIHKDTHTAVITNCFNQILLELKISNSNKDFKKLVSKAERLSKKNNFIKPIFGLEDSYGYGSRLAKYLYQNGYLVKVKKKFCG